VRLPLFKKDIIRQAEVARSALDNAFKKAVHGDVNSAVDIETAKDRISMIMEICNQMAHDE